MNKPYRLRRGSKDETWEQPWGEQRLVRDNHNELHLSSDTFSMRFRLFDEALCALAGVNIAAEHILSEVDNGLRVICEYHGGARALALYERAVIFNVIDARELMHGAAEVRNKFVVGIVDIEVFH